MVPLILEIPLLHALLLFYLNKILWDIKIFSKHLRYINSYEIRYISILLQTFWHGITFFEKFLWHVSQAYLLSLKDVTG